MLRRSRHRVVTPPRFSNFKTAGTDNALATAALFNHFRLIPFNWMHALVPNSGSYAGFRNLCGQMKDDGLFTVQTFHGAGFNNETLTFSRTDAGKRFLEKYNREAYSDYNTATDAEQLLIDQVDQQLILGSHGSDVEVHLWHDIRIHPQTPELPDNPYRFYIGTNPATKKPMFFVCDGLPIYLKRQGKSLLFLKEVVRTNKTRAVIKHKASLYKQNEQEIKDRFGFKALMVLFVATSERDRDNILRWINEEIGPCSWMLVAYTPDPLQQCLSTTPVTTHLFTEPWQRAGHSDFSLTTLSEV